MIIYVGLFVHSAVEFYGFMFYHVFMSNVGLLIVRLCFISDILSFIDLFICISADVSRFFRFRF